MAKAEKRMDITFSVFNCHVNNAKERATAEFVAQYGQENYDKHIAPIDEAGIMTIFHRKPTQYTAAWVTLVTAYVNENRVAAD